MGERGGERHLVVVGGGITGLAAAWELSRAATPPRITVREAHRVGGKLQSSPFAGLAHVDEAADAFLARVPWARQLCTELGLTDLVSPATGAAWVWHGGRLHPIPDGLVLGVPSGLGGLLRSRLLSPAGVARAGLDLVRPRTPPDHDCLGTLIRDRFGAQVLERLVDPLVGSINAGDADHLSLAASTPQIAEPARRSRSLLLALRSLKPTGAGPSDPVFLTPRDGMASLATTLGERLRAAGVTFDVGRAVSELARDGDGWRVDGEPADAVVLATPADTAAHLLAPHSPDAAAGLGAIPYAGVVMVTVHTRTPVALHGSGYLVPKPEQRHLTAASVASRKWAHWQPAGGGSLLRLSLGRLGNQAPLDFDDEQAAQTAVDEASRHLGTPLDVAATRVTRWHRSFPQYLPHHLDRVAALERQVSVDAPGVHLAGAAYRGVGVPACIRQGREAAGAALARLAADD